MKLSEVKNKVIEKYGEKEWKEEIENTYTYKVYTASEEEQLKLVRNTPFIIRNINNPSEKVQLEAVKQNVYALQYMNNPTEKVLKYVFKYILKNDLYEMIHILRHVENDLKEGEE